MDEVSVVVQNDGNNLSNTDWFLSGLEEDGMSTSSSSSSSLPLDASEGGLFTGNFVPPPPRPLFLDESITPDGLTTCDLCSWAWQNGNTYTTDTNLEAPPGELGWVLTLVIVSLISAILGAIIMIVVLHCRRLKNSSSNGSEHRSPSPNPRLRPNRPPINTPDDKNISTIALSHYHQSNQNQANISGVWSWLSRRSTTTPTQLNHPPSSLVENHYTHMEDGYNSVGDALYAELDLESTDRESNNSPAYQNSAYTDPDAPTSSAPSSAYYSDLSVTTTVPDRAYEVVGLATMPIWEHNGGEMTNRKPAPPRLAAISENVSSVPSDYV